MTSTSTAVPTDGVAALVEPALRACLDRLDDATRRVCAYHLGFDGAQGDGGKRVRAALALLSAQAAGAPATDGVPAAVACELVHNFSLLHDDVMDRDEQRRHRATAWTVFGAPAAILAGDAMLALAGELLAEVPSPTVSWAIGCLNAATRRLIAGQAADLAFETRDDVSLDECLRMAGDKTGALLACSASLGAVLVDAPSQLALGLAEFGTHLGMAFQLNDDLLGIWGDPARTGKPVWSDLRSRKKSVPVVAALTSGSAAGEQLSAIYRGRDPLDDRQLERAAALVERAGGREWARQEVRRRSQLCAGVLDQLSMPGSARSLLATLAGDLSSRDH